MKIAVNTRFLIKDKLEGIGRFTYESVKELALQQAEHEFIFFFDRPYDESFVFAPNITPVVLFPPARHPFLFYLWFEFAVHRALKKYKADVFLSTDGFLSLSTKVPTVLVIHDIAFFHFPDQVRFWEKRYYGYFMAKFIRKAERLIAVSQYTKDDIVSHYNVAADKIDIAYNACRDNFRPLAAKEQASIRKKYAAGKPYFLYIGSVHPRKNIVRLLLAFDLFKKQTGSDLKLLLAGRLAWQTGAVNAAYQQISCQGDVVFLDFVPTQELPKITAAAFALTYVSILEGFGIPILEAMMCDVPVLTSNRSSMPEVAGKAGLLVDPFSEKSIALGMTALWEDESLRNKLVERGRVERTRFSWANTARQIWVSISGALVSGAG